MSDVYQGKWLEAKGNNHGKTAEQLRQLVASAKFRGYAKVEIEVTSVDAMRLQAQLTREREAAKVLEKYLRLYQAEDLEAGQKAGTGYADQALSEAKRIREGTKADET